MTDEPWTIARIERERPDLAPLARLHRELDATARRFDTSKNAALHPSIGGAPATHWMAGRSLFDSANRAALTPSVSALFTELAQTTRVVVPDASAAIGEILSAASAPGFPWPARIVKFRDVPDAAAVPHAALFRFLLMRAVAVPAEHLARSLSPPHPDRWRSSNCPYCGVPAAASVAGQGTGRTLLCVLCGGRWRREGLDCIACGDERPESRLVLARRELGPASIEACGACRSAFKVFADADLPYGPPTALEVLTVHLDVLAGSDDLARPETALAAVFPPP